MKYQLTLFLLIAGLTTSGALAGENLRKTLMTERGKLVYSDDLNKTAWRAGKGRWEIVDGAMKGSELKSDKHGAVARHPLPFKDAVIQFDIQLNGSRQATFSINDAKEHVCRVLVNPAGFRAQKDDHDHDGPDKSKPFNLVSLPFKPGAWHTVLIEIRGEELLVTIEGESSAGSDPLIGTSKANFGFTVAGESASFRNLKVWEAQANPAWEQNKKLISAAKR